MTKVVFPKRDEWSKYKAKFTKDSLVIAGHSIMESWETPYMKMLASIVTRNGGTILEVGYGLGLACNFIEKNSRVRSHSIVEFHPDVMEKCRGNGFKKINLLEGFWEDILPKLESESFDGILFDIYPLDKEENKNSYFPYFEEAYRLLKEGGVLTYYSDECRNFSKLHLKKLKEAGFTKIEFKICKVNPTKECNYWDKKTILAPIITK